jgi:serine phosphatase RsbU (regulator of sigma subunit)
MKSLGLKLSMLYIFLAIINISFFTILIHINQLDLIIKIKKYESLQFATDVSTEINAFVISVNRNREQYADTAAIEYATLDTCSRVLAGNSFILFDTDGRVIHESYPDTFAFKDTYVLEAQNAITRREFSSKLFTASFINDREIQFYIPLEILNIKTIILLFRLDISDIHENLAAIYRIVTIFIICITIFHVLFGIILHRIVLSPINVLSARSIDISRGNYNARVKLKRADEFGILTTAFNNMAQSIQEKIEYLDKMNTKMKLELQMASEVQKSIYPKIRKTRYFDIAIYHKPLIEVSGDYHDIFPIGEERYGFIIADVCGHGISAALITMLIKEKCEEIASTYLDTKKFLQHINIYFGDLMSTYDKFFSAFYIIVDGKNRNITFSNAGQPASFLIRNNKIYQLNTDGYIIGFSQSFNSTYESKRIKFIDLDKIIIITDGIYETVNENREQYGYKRFMNTAAKKCKLPCDEMLEAILSDISAFRGNSERKDDETLIIIDIKKKDKSSTP